MLSRSSFKTFTFFEKVIGSSSVTSIVCEKRFPAAFGRRITNFSTWDLKSIKSPSTSNRQFIPQSSLFTTAVVKVEAATLAMTMAPPQDNHITSLNNNGVLEESVTVIRYQPGEERFKMQITLLNGKTFNFDRSCRDTVENVLTRMVTNISKKLKKFDGTVNFLKEGVYITEGINPEVTEIDYILKQSMNLSSMKLQVGEDLYSVVFNPPEVYIVKFLGAGMPTYPFFPYRMETSENFLKEKSLYKWEFSREMPSPKTPPKLQKKSKLDNNMNSRAKDEWITCGTSLIFTPEKGMEGGYLRFSCIPSNGITFGKAFTTVLSTPIVNLTVDKLIYEERLARLGPKSENQGSLRVLSYNVLADCLCTPEWFTNSPKESLEPSYRYPILNKEIQSYQADLICLQEVDQRLYEGNFEPFMGAQGYRGFHTVKTGNTKEGIATFYNPDKLTIKEFYFCVVREHMKTLPMWTKLETVGKPFIEKLEERNTVFHVSVFEVNNCPKNTILLLGNVHLFFHPDADHIRLLQTITCLDFLQSKLDDVKRMYPERRVAVMFCGDFNCTPPFSSFRLLTTGKVEENDEDWTSYSEEKISPGIAFSHTLKFTNSHPGEELTNITTAFEGCLDYILFQSEHMELVNAYPPPSKDTLAELTKVDEPRKVSLPNFYAPSDHLPLIADLKFKL